MTYRLVSLAGAFFVGACSPATSHTSDDKARLALELITEERLLAHVTFLADDALEGREAGEPGYDAAADYVAEQLASMGVTPGGDGWFQTVRMRRYKVDTDSPTMTLHRDGIDTEFAYRDDFAVEGDSVREHNSVRAGVVYVGYGVHAPEFGYSDYDGIDVRGKIVAGFGGAPPAIEGEERAHYASTRNKRKEAVARGAVGTITLRSRRAEERRAWNDAKKKFGTRWQMTWINDAGEARGYFEELQSAAFLSMPAAEQLFGLSPLSYEQALDKTEASEPASVNLGVEVTLARTTTHTSSTSPNVVGIVRGTDPELADEYVVYSAHLDHIGVGGDDEDRVHNGAYDNAMGIALMLETARVIAAAPPKRSVMFVALTAEEKGLIGSDYFVHNPPVPIGSMVANINLDMPLFLFPVADLIAFGSQHSSLQAVVESSAAKEGFTFSPDPVPEENLFVRSDQYSFVRRGVPAVYLIPGFTSLDDKLDGEALFRDHIDNHYHEPSDDLTRPIDWDSAIRFARAHTRIGFAVATATERPSWNEGDFFGRQFAGGN